MSFFSRLSDIISCNVNEMLAQSADPLKAIHQVISEMEEGLAGATRSVNAASNAEQRLRGELEEHRTQVAGWAGKAREELGNKREDLARVALLRKRELEDLLAGLEQQHAASVSTRDQLTTTLRAISARLADARRVAQALEANQPDARFQTAVVQSASGAAAGVAGVGGTLDQARDAQIDAELEALRRELGQGR